MRKRIHFLLGALFVALLCTACKEGGRESKLKTPTYLDIIFPNTDVANATQTELSVLVYTDVAWTAELEDPSWCRILNLRQESDHTGEFTLSFIFNDSEDPRTSAVIIKCGTQTERKEFMQTGLPDLFQPHPLRLRSTEAAELVFTPFMDWTLDVSESDEQWLLLPEARSGAAGKKVKLSLAAREEFVDVGTREGTLLFTFGPEKKQVSVPVLQYQKDAIFLGEEAVSLEFFPSTFSIGVDTNIEFSVDLGGADWVHLDGVTPTKVLDHSEAVFSVDRNEGELARSTVIRFAGTGENGAGPAGEVTLTQAGKDPILNVSTEGIYGVGGYDYILEPNVAQSSRTTLGDGNYIYRLLHLDKRAVCTVGSIPEDLADGAAATLHITLYRNEITLVNTDIDCIQLGSDADLRWLKGNLSQNVNWYFIVAK